MPPIDSIFSLIVSDKANISSIKYYQIIFISLLRILCLHCLFISNLLKINHLSINNNLFIIVYFVSFENFFPLLRECHFANSPIKSKGLDRYLRECMRE